MKPINQVVANIEGTTAALNAQGHTDVVKGLDIAMVFIKDAGLMPAVAEAAK